MRLSLSLSAADVRPGVAAELGAGPGGRGARGWPVRRRGRAVDGAGGRAHHAHRRAVPAAGRLPVRPRIACRNGSFASRHTWDGSTLRTFRPAAQTSHARGSMAAESEAMHAAHRLALQLPCLSIQAYVLFCSPTAASSLLAGASCCWTAAISTASTRTSACRPAAGPRRSASRPMRARPQPRWPTRSRPAMRSTGPPAACAAWPRPPAARAAATRAWAALPWRCVQPQERPC